MQSLQGPRKLAAQRTRRPRDTPIWKLEAPLSPLGMMKLTKRRRSKAEIGVAEVQGDLASHGPIDSKSGSVVRIRAE